MKESITVRCPVCGQWVEIPYLNAINRMAVGTVETFSKSQEVFAGIKNKKIKKVAEGISGYVTIASGIPLLKGAYDAMLCSPYEGTCPKCGYEFSYDDDSEDQSEEYDKFEADLIEKENRENLSFLLVERAKDIDPDNDEEMLDFIEDINSRLNVEQDNSLRAKLYGASAYIHWLLGKDDKVIDLVSMATNEANSDSDICSAVAESFVYLNQIRIESGDEDISKELYAGLPYLLNYKEQDKWQIVSEYEYNDAFQKSKVAYLDHFLAIPPTERRVIVFSHEFNKFPEQFFVLPLDVMPKGLKIYRNEPPQENEIYIMHPYKPYVYFRAKDYAIGLFRDKIDEFKRIMVSLGAKKVSFSDVRESLNEDKENTNISASAKASVAGKGSGNLSIEHRRALEQERGLYDEIAEDGEYRKTDIYPSLPDNLVWYPRDDEWQTEVDLRLKGHTEKKTWTISLNTNEVINKKKQTDIKAGLKVLVGSGEAECSIDEEIFSSIKQQHSWKCTVEFYPLSEYTKK